VSVKYNHAISLNFELDSDNEVPTSKEILRALKDKVATLNLENIEDEVEIFDSAEE
jgi:hypothetical protein